MFDIHISVRSEDRNTSVFGVLRPYLSLTELAPSGVHKPVTDKPLKDLKAGETTKGSIDVQGFRGKVILFQRHRHVVPTFRYCGIRKISDVEGKR